MSIKVFTPKTMKEAAEILKADNGKIIAGGTDLVIELHKERIEPGYMVDLGGVDELRLINIGADSIKLGSMVTFSQIIQNDFIKEKIPSLWEAAKKMGATQIQNRATIGGNICNAAPAADSIPVFMSLQAECVVFGLNGRRNVSIREFVIGRGKNCLNKGELLEAVVFKLPDANTGLGFTKLGKRNALAISTISCAVRMEAANGKIAGISVYTGSLGTKSEEEVKTQAFLVDKEISGLDLDEAAEVLSREVEERLGSRASIVYKKEAVKGIFKEAAGKAISHLAYKKGGVLR